ncbi:MAG TPA: amidohydrolase family protein [Candidatus Binataceae bacterium]|nr:amidohydrolase family protein [Candidatus Binataceae bacterium]
MSFSYQGRNICGIDVHTHVPRRPGLAVSASGQQMARYFQSTIQSSTIEEMADLYRRMDLLAVTFSVDAETVSGVPFDGNDYVADIQRRYPDVFIGWASVDPHKGKLAVQELERSVKELGLRGLKLHPITQAFFPDDQAFYPLWAKAAELGVPVVFHTGHTGVGSGGPGGTGLKLKYAQPIHLDDVAADFPTLTIIGAHPSWPWQDEMLSICLHKSNVFIDLSGWSPKYFSPALIQYANTLLQNKVMFGSDFPVISPERWLKDFEAAAFRDEVRPKIMLENARRVLKLEA